MTSQRLKASQLLPRAFQFGEQLHPGGSSLKLGFPGDLGVKNLPANAGGTV